MIIKNLNIQSLSKTVGKVVLAAAVPLVLSAQANAQAQPAARAARQLVKPPTSATGAATAKPALRAVNPADGAFGVMNPSVAETILRNSRDQYRIEVLNFLESDKARELFTPAQIDTVKEAAARDLLNAKSTVACLSGLTTSQENYIKVVEAGLAILRDKGMSFDTAMRSDDGTLANIALALTKTVGSLNNQALAVDLAMERTGSVVKECAVRQETNPLSPGNSKFVKANY